MATHSDDGLRRRLSDTGIGYAGVEGVWWRPACEPFPLPNEVAGQLDEIGPALFAFFDAIVDLYKSGTSHQLKWLLEYKVPDYIQRLVAEGRVDSLRPDFQLYPASDGSSAYRLVLTELEICPSAHGFCHAMQAAYGLPIDLVEGFARYLDGRNLLFAGTQAWSEFLFEQLLFCQALADEGIVGRVLYDLPLATMAEEIRRGERWLPPLFGIPEKTPDWNDDVLGRLREHDLESFLWPIDETWPLDVGDAVVFRFGYFDCFRAKTLHHFQRWQSAGAYLLNPTTFFLENKSIMAALNLAAVRRRLDESSLAVLDRCIPETFLLTEESLARLYDERADWVVKYAAYDGGNKAWGGRSLEIGARHTAESWQDVLERYLALPWPVVAQRAIPTARVDLCYVDNGGSRQLLRDGHTRLRVFFLRDNLLPGGLRARTIACGSHITISGGSGCVSEGLDAIQAPVVFV